MSPAQAYLRPAADEAHSVEVVVHNETGVLHVVTLAGEKRDQALWVLFKESMADKRRD